MANVKLIIKDNPIGAFVENITAYQIFPYHVETRRQVPGSFLAMVTTGRANVDPDAAKMVWDISDTVSPYDTANLVARASYDLNFGDRSELDWIAGRLRKVAPWHLETWIIDGYAALLDSDRDRLRAALEKAKPYMSRDNIAILALEEQSRSLQ